MYDTITPMFLKKDRETAQPKGIVGDAERTSTQKGTWGNGNLTREYSGKNVISLFEEGKGLHRSRRE